jgi:hypothetical protein
LLADTSTNIAGGLAGGVPYQTSAGVTTFLPIGSSGFVLTAGATAPQWTSITALSAGTAVTATNVAAGLAGQLVYQSAPGISGFVTTSTVGSILSSNGSSAPSYVTQSSLSVGTATSSTKWTTARTVTFTGDTTGTFTIDGSADVSSVNLTIQPNSVTLGTDTTGDYVSTGATSGYGLSGSTTGETQTFTVTSNGTSSNTISTLVFRDASGNFSASTITAGLTGTASKATNIVGGLAGSLPYQTAADTTTMLALGTSGYVLTAGATAPQWTSFGGVSVGTATNSTNAAITNDTATITPQYITFVSTSTGNTGIKTAAAGGLTYIPSSGYHGIGIDIPTAPLHLVSSVNSVIKFTGGSTGALGILSSDATKISLTDSTTGEAFIITPGSNSLTLTTNAFNRVTVDINGQVKIIAGIAASSTSTGGLVVNGGVGIGDKLYVGGLITGGAGLNITGVVTATSFSGNISGNATNIAGGAIGSLPYQSNTATTSFLAIGTAGYFLTVNTGATAPQWTQTLTAANGGTGVNTLTGIAYGNGTSAFTAATGAQISTALSTTNISGNAANVTGIVATNNGGTGLSSWTAGDIAYYSTGTALTKLTIGTNGFVLTSNGSAPTWAAVSGITAGSATKATNLAGGTQNQIPYQTAPDTTAFSNNLLWNTATSTLTIVGTFSGYAFTRTGNINATAWTTTSPILHSAAGLLTDTTAVAGTVSMKVGASLFSPNYASTNAITVTDAVNLFVQAPVASTNVTITNNWGIYNTGASYVGASQKVTTSLAVGSYSTTANTGDILASGNAMFGYSSAQSSARLSVSGNVFVNGVVTATSFSGAASSVASAVTFNNGGSGAVSGTTFNGSSAVTVSYNTVGAQVAGTYVTSVTGTSPVASSGGVTPAISLAAAYGDTLNPYASKTANYFLAAPTGVAGVPTFRAIVAADIPTLNQNSSGSAGSVANSHTAGTGLSGTTFNGSAAVTWTLATAYGDGTNPYASKTANYVLAAPNGLAGAPTFRALVAADIPTLNQNSSGSAGSVTNSLTAGTGLSGTAFNGSAAVTWTNAGVTSNVAGTGVTVSGATGAVTISIGQAVATSSNVQFNSLGVGTAGSAVAGEIRATNEITAYYSDRRLKENVKVIDNAVDKVLSLNGIIYTPNDLARSFGYTSDKTIVGLFADEVDAVLPEAVRPAPFDQDENGNSKSGENYKTIQYEKLVPLLVEAIKEQQKQIAQLSETIRNMVNK